MLDRDGTTRSERMHLLEGIDRYPCIGLITNALWVQVQWTDSLGVAHRSFRSLDLAGEARCRICQPKGTIQRTESSTTSSIPHSYYCGVA